LFDKLEISLSSDEHKVLAKYRGSKFISCNSIKTSNRKELAIGGTFNV